MDACGQGQPSEVLPFCLHAKNWRLSQPALLPFLVPALFLALFPSPSLSPSLPLLSVLLPSWLSPMLPLSSWPVWMKPGE